MTRSFDGTGEGYRYSTMTVQHVIDAFIRSISSDVESWRGDDKLCVIGIEPDGVFYAEPLASALGASLTFMTQHGVVQDEELLRGAKVLLIDNDIISGKTYRVAMASIKRRIAELQIKDLKYAVLDDRKGLADFAAGRPPRPIGALEASRRLGVNRHTFTRMCQQGRIPGATRKGNRWIVDSQELEKLKNSYTPVRGRPKKIAP